MPTQRISPPLRQQVLGRRLRELRQNKRLLIADAAKRLRADTGRGWSEAKLGRIETSATLSTPGDVNDLLDLYQADPATRRECLELVQQARTRPWWKSYTGMPADYVALETEARRIRYWQAQLIPGLLQTREYAQLVIAADSPWVEPDIIALKAKARIARQWVLTSEDPLSLEAIIGEDALRRPIGANEVMADQLTRLLDVMAKPNIKVWVMPRDVGAHPGLTCSFVLLTLPDMPTTVFRESGSGGILDQGPEVPEFEMRFEHIAAFAKPPTESADLIATIRRDLWC